MCVTCLFRGALNPFLGAPSSVQCMSMVVETFTPLPQSSGVVKDAYVDQWDACYTSKNASTLLCMHV